MKWIMNTKNLRNTLNNSVDFTEKNGVTETFKSLCFEFEDNSDMVAITATNAIASAGATTRLEALDFEADNEVKNFLVDAKKLLNIVKTVTTDYIEFETTKKGALVLRSSKTVYKLPTSSVNEYIEAPEIDTEAFGLPVGQMLYLLNKVAFAASDDVTKGNMRGVYLESLPGKFYMSATDSFQLAHSYIDTEYTTFEISLMIAKDDALRLKKVLEGFDPSETMLCHLDENLMDVWLKDTHKGIVTRVWFRLLSGNFVNYSSIFRDTANEVIVEKSALVDVLKKATPAISKDSPVLKLSVHTRNIVIESNDDATQFRGEVRTEYTGEEMEVGLSAKFLSNIISHLDSEKIVLDILDEENTVQIYRYKEAEREYDRHEIYVIMPMEI